MKISELISKLQAAMDAHGDVMVCVREDGFGGHAMNMIADIDNALDELYPGEVEEHDPGMVKELWGIDGIDIDAVYDELHLTIRSGTTLYTT